MCRGKEICTELGTQKENWDPDCPLRLPEQYQQDLDVFIAAFIVFYQGHREKCVELIKSIRNEEIQHWYIEHGQMAGRHRKIALNMPTPIPVEQPLRDPIRSPQKVQSAVFKRDNYRCRYCGNRLIDQRVMKQFIKDLADPIFERGKTNLTTHGIIHITWPVADHVIPWNLGGGTDLNNLVSSCAPCNYGKDGFTLEQLGMSNPYYRLPAHDGWNGLTAHTG